MQVGVLIPFNGHDLHRNRLYEWVSKFWRSRLDSQFIFAPQMNVDNFSRSGYRNLLFNHLIEAGCDIVVSIDADTFCDPTQIHQAIEVIEKDLVDVVYPFNVYYNLNRETTDKLLDIDPSEDFSLPSDPANFGYDHEIFHSPGGILVIKSEVFLGVDGYDERFIGWGYEDNAFRRSLELYGASRMELRGLCLHLWHPVGQDSGFNSPNIYHNRDLFVLYNKCQSWNELTNLRSIFL